jgi:hypothetical protein
VSSPHDDILAHVPESTAFLTVDELEASTDDLLARCPRLTARQCGRSRQGHPIRCLEVGEGPLHAVLIGLPHPEEPVGTLLLEYLLPLLATTDLARELGFRFSIVKVGDPDGTRVNEPWFAAPHDLERLLLNVYRPASSDQLEWAFPFSYKGYAYTRPLPEAQAIMDIVDRAPVDFIMGLHNSTFCGAYFYVTEADADLAARLGEAADAAGIPRHRGEPEVPYLETLGDAVFRNFGLRDEYDYLQSYGQTPAALLDSGTSSDDYAGGLWGSYSLTAEVPYFSSPKIADLAPAGVTRAEAKLRGIEIERRHLKWMAERFPEVAAELTRETPWLRTVRSYLMQASSDLAAEREMVDERPEFRDEATVAQLFDSVYLRELFALCRVGQFAQAAAAEAASNAALDKVAGEARERVSERAARLQVAGGLEPVALHAAVQVQLAALLHTLDHVRESYRLEHPRPKV